MFTNRSVAPALVTVWAALLALPARAEESSGERIYRRKCMTCHGPNGQGTKRHRTPLAGDRSLSDLATVIARTMPEDLPGSLSPAEAQRVAAYIHGAFYSRAAQERTKPARIALARLTVRQYRYTVADLLGSFRGPARWDERRGLRAEYYKKRGFRPDNRVLERTDPEVHFDFGTDSPVPDKAEAHEFSIRWTGSVIAPETGEHEFVLRTEHAARLWVNDPNRPLIDAWVKSGNDREYRGSIFLLAGRAYPLRLEYSKAKQGVDDSKKGRKPPPVRSSIALEWKPPQQALDTVPARCLVPVVVPESFAIATPFPPGDPSYGWERGTTVSREWDQAATEAAIEAASYVASRINALAGTRDGAPDRGRKVGDFCRRFAERAFRRPLKEEELRLVVDGQLAGRDMEIGVKRVVLRVLKSPRFLYREVGSPPDGYDVAARLSFGLWDSAPDAELLAAAADGRLAARDQVARQAELMLADPRARAKLRGFLLTWLKVDHAPDIAKDAKRFPGFDTAMISDLRTSLELALNDALGGKEGGLRSLLLSDSLYLNGRLGKFYGADLPPDAGFTQVKVNPEHRAGVLTHPYLMAAFAYTGETSPIHRGVFVARGLLGLALRPPPEAFTPLAADLHPSLTTLERVLLQTRPAACAACHGVINPLGFPLEHFDAVGRFREKDNAKPVDVTGSYVTRNGQRVTFTGARNLAAFLAGSAEVHDAFVEQMFHHLVQQPVRAYGAETLADLRRRFAESAFDLRKLAVEIMAVSAPAPPGPARQTFNP